MSLTRLAGGGASLAVLGERNLPWGSSRRTASALTERGRPFWAQAGAVTKHSATLRPRMARTAPDSTKVRGPVGQQKPLSDGALELLRGLEAGRAPARHVHGLARSRVLALARLAPAPREGPETHEGHRLAALERGADGDEQGAEGAVGGGFRPPAGFGHCGHKVGSGHRRCLLHRMGR